MNAGRTIEKNDVRTSAWHRAGKDRNRGGREHEVVSWRWRKWYDLIGPQQSLSAMCGSEKLIPSLFSRQNHAR
jgi:hypothetical protein